MNEKNDVVSIRLLDREYQIKCPAEKLADLQEAATYLDSKMRQAQENGKTLGIDRLIMIAALNITSEMVSLKRQKDCYIDNMNLRIQEIQNKIDQALAE
jgi:cell division protein ZapA